MSANYSNSRMIRVSHTNPCPVCKKPDWCLVAEDGSAAICPRTEPGSVKRCGDAGWLHILKDSTTWYSSPSPPQSTFKKKSPPRDWSTALVRFQKRIQETIDELAAILGVSRVSLEQIGTGYDGINKWWTIPEKNAEGTVIGIQHRDRKGVKKQISKSQRGLYYSADWLRHSGAILLVEGASDTAAVLTLELCGIGRPSNLGGIDHLIGLLDSIPLDREIVVIGERDQKPDGKWPGRTGAISTANQLAEALERPIAWSFPPDNSKDTRAWLQSVPKNLPIDRMADLFLSGLNKDWVQPIPLHRTPTPSGPAIKLEDWRNELLALRIASLRSPGCYLDASPTGSGKSHVDLHALVLVFQRGVP